MNFFYGNKMKKKIGIAIVLGFFSYVNSYSQNESDALRYSRQMPGGTARYVSMGGALGALGADYSVVSSNPAGLGLFRKNQITFSPSVFTGSTQSNYWENNSTNSRTIPNISNFGIVLCGDYRKNKRPDQGFQYVQFSIGYNKTNHLANRTVLLGDNDQSSIISEYLRNLQNGNASAFYEQLALNTDVIISQSGSYSAFGGDWPAVKKTQSQYITERGSQGEVNLNLSANLANKLYMGVGLNYSVLNYTRYSSFEETYAQSSNPELRYFNINESLITSGGGANIRLGLIYTPADFFRLGVSFHSPTWYRLNDKFQNDMTASYYTTPAYQAYTRKAESPYGAFLYRYRNPLKVQASAGFIIAKLATIGVEYEFMDYSTNRFSAVNDGFAFLNQLNSRINSTFDQAHTIRVGGELKMDPVSVRLGFNYMTSPFSVNFTNESPVFIYSGGLGYKFKKGFFLDAAYQLFQTRMNYYPYAADIAQPAELKIVRHNLIFTAGVNF